jgi:predicted PurR-regulated permease PerM
MSHTFKPILMFRIKLVATLKLALLLATYIVYLLRPQVNKLRRRLQGRRGRHDAPRLELPRLRREP